MSSLRGRGGLTLTELMVALSLVSIIALAATHLELGSRHYFLLDRRRSTLLNEGMAALEHITRTVRYSANPQLAGGVLTLQTDWPNYQTVRAPSDPAPNTPVTYRFQNGQLIYNNGVGDEILARYVNTAASSFALSGRTVTATIVTTTQGETATVTSAASTRFVP